MAAVQSSSVFSRSKSGSHRASDATDAEFEFDVREDEEQGVKLGQTVDLLLAAGYFRARIKGLSPFDKVVGGMVWCITTCNFDVDVDLLFQENSTIGQKIALTEKIVSVLPRMKCPHSIEPHQIQGLDFIHIFPVVQWLVKKAIETREEMGDYIRQYSISQFDKNYSMPEDEEFKKTLTTSVKTVKDVKEAYRPERQFKRHDAESLIDEEIRVHSTLLEYGRKIGLGRSGKSGKDSEMASKKAAIKAGLAGQEKDLTDEEAQEEEERRLQQLMKGMTVAGSGEGKLTASAVGSLVGMQAEEIQQIASRYADMQNELDVGEKGTKMAGSQQHKRIAASLQKQIDAQQEKLKQAQSQHKELSKALEQTQSQLKKVQDASAQLDEEISQLCEAEAEANQGVMQTLRSLVAMNENLKKQEQQFRAHCKDEMNRLQREIARLKAEGGLDEESEEQERKKLIDQQYAADKEKLQKLRLLLAKKNREISGLQRKIDEVPTRAELSQYQRRFIELYNQVAAKYKETKQFYTLYNTLDDTKLYLNKEVNLLNSIHDNFATAMMSPGNREQFLKQMEQIVEGVKQNRIKLEQKKQSEKMQRDLLNDQYLDLVEKQRLYFKTVRDFKEECRKNEILLAKTRNQGDL